MATAKAVSLSIPAIETATILLKIEGKTPLLVNRFSDKAIQTIEDTQAGKPKSKKHEARDPKQEFLDSRYVVGGKDCFPARGFLLAAIRAGKAVGKNMTDMRSGLRTVEDFVEVKAKAPKMMTHDIRLPNKAGGVAYRAAYYPWSIDLMLTFDRAFLNEAEVVNLMNRAGWGVGVGAWRPEKNGSFGTFEVKQRRGK